MKKILYLVISLMMYLIFSNISYGFSYDGNYYNLTSIDSGNFNGKIIDSNLNNIDYIGYFSSDVNATLSLTFDKTNGEITGSVNNLGKNTLFGIKFKDISTGKEKTYFLNFLSTQDFSIIGTETSSIIGKNIDINIIDNEYDFTHNKTIKNINNYSGSLIFEYSGDYIFDIQKVNDIYYLNKRNRNFEILNSYEIEFYDNNDVLLDNTTIDINLFKYMYYAGNNILYVNYNNNILAFINDGGGKIDTSGGTVSLKDLNISGGNTYSPKLINGWLQTDYDVLYPNATKTIQAGDMLYTLNNTNFKIDYLNGGSYSNKENIFNGDISALNITDFYIIDNNIFLYSKTSGLYYLDGNFVLYLLYNTNGDIVKKTSFNSLSYDFSYLYKQGDLSLNGDLGSILNTPKYNGGKLYNETYISDKQLYLDLYPDMVNLNTFTDTLNLKKYSSLNDVNSINNSIILNATMPIIGFGITLESVKDGETCSNTNNIQLNTPVTSLSKLYDVNDGNYCIYISPYDEGFNTTLTPFITNSGNPIKVVNETIQFGEPEIERNDLVDGTTDVSFYVSSNKELKTISIKYEARDGTIVTNTNTDTGSGRVQLVSSINGNYKYVFTTKLDDLNKTTKFTINGEDYYLNQGSLVYQYDFLSGYFQVLGLTKTNDILGVYDNVNKNQTEKGFMYGLISGNSQNESNINSLFFFNSNTSNSNESINIPVDNLGNIQFDLLKFNIGDFKGRIKKDFNYSNTINDYVFQNKYYYYYDGDLLIDNELDYYGNGILLVKGKVSIKNDIIKNISTETSKYNNKLKIYSTRGIEIFPSVTKIDADLLTGDSNLATKEEVITYTNINGNSVISGLADYVDTNGQFIYGVSAFGGSF